MIPVALQVRITSLVIHKIPVLEPACLRDRRLIIEQAPQEGKALSDIQKLDRQKLAQLHDKTHGLSRQNLAAVLQILQIPTLGLARGKRLAGQSRMSHQPADVLAEGLSLAFPLQ